MTWRLTSLLCLSALAAALPRSAGAIEEVAAPMRTELERPDDAKGSDRDFVTAESRLGFGETLAWLTSAIATAGGTIFATIDHARAAQEAGLALRPTTLLIFGNPKAGTLLMQSRQTAGLDLPLRMLVWQDEGGRTWTSYDDPASMARRHGLDPAGAVVKAMSAMLAHLAGGAP